MKLDIIVVLLSITFLSLLDVLFDYVGIPKNMFFAGLWIVCVLSFLFSFYRLLSDFTFENTYFKLLFTSFFLYGILTVLRGWSFSSADLTSFLRVPYVFWPFLMPLFIFMNKKLSTISFIFDCFYYLGLIFILVAILFPNLLVFRPTSEPLIFSLAFGAGLLLLNSIYLDNSRVNVSLLIFIISTLCMIYLARRTSAILFIVIIFASYILTFFSKVKPFIFRVLPLIVILSIIIFFSLTNFSKLLTSKLDNRLNEDTRSTVIEYFMKGMSNDIVFGKGMNGKYFCPIGGGAARDDGMVWKAADYRDIIENGYLQLILSGGYVHLLLFLLIIVPASFNGIFRSKNQFTRSCGVFLLIWLFYMLGYGEPRLSVGYMIVWIAVSVCFKPSIRNMTDLEVILGLNSSKIKLTIDNSKI